MTDLDKFPEDQGVTATPMFNNKTYDYLKKGVQLVLPAIASLYFGLAAIWGLPYADQVVGTLALVATFGGVLLSLSTKSYNSSDTRFDGRIDIAPDEEAGVTNMNVSLDPHAVASKGEVVVKINRV